MAGTLVSLLGGRLQRLPLDVGLGLTPPWTLLSFVTSSVVKVRHGPVVGLGKWVLMCPVPGDLAYGTWIVFEWPCVEQVCSIGVLKLGTSCPQSPADGPATVPSVPVRPRTLLTNYSVLRSRLVHPLFVNSGPLPP